MPQSSVAYAVGRIRAASHKPLGDAQLERLLSASSYQEAVSLLAEMGWQDTEQVGIERLSISRMEKICDVLRDITPDQNLTDIFLLRHDIQNLKALLKARVLGDKPEALSGCGTLSIDMLSHAVTEHSYAKLPETFRNALNFLERRLALDVDPMEIDVRLDQTLYAEIGLRLKAVKSDAVRRYFMSQVDFKNAVAYLRLHAMGKAQNDFLDIILPGGTVSKAKWTAILKKPETIGMAFRGYGASYSLALLKAQSDASLIPMLEKMADDHLLSIFRPYRNDPYAIEVLAGWLLAHEREAGAVRLIMAGKLNDFPEEAIRERLREAYGR